MSKKESKYTCSCAAGDDTPFSDCPLCNGTGMKIPRIEPSKVVLTRDVAHPKLLPLLLAHDRNRVCGFMEWRDGKIIVTINDPVRLHKDAIFECFGNVGMRIIEREDDIIKKFEILEISLTGTGML